MKYDWITLAMEKGGGVLTAYQDSDGIIAIMEWEECGQICGVHRSTLPDALTSLNASLEDDAADACEC